uniref:Anaphase-promoting complex subunit 4-like WD40 domain-containing protein n=1 Tax=Romanomermis culicivorax TaxID=13658 RepID=A0A915IK94_ROMCU
MLFCCQEDPIMEKHIQAHSSAVLSLSFNSDGSQLASGCKHGSVKIWKLGEKWTCLAFKDDESAVHCVRFTPCGRLLASSSGSYVKLRIPDRQSDYWAFKAHSLTIRCIQFSPDGCNMATCSDDRSIKVWAINRFNKHKFLYSLTEHNNWVRYITYSLDGDKLVSCGDDSLVKVWDLNTKSCMSSLEGHNGIVKCVNFHPNGYSVASASNDNTVRIWDIRKNKCVQVLNVVIGSVNCLQFHKTGKYLACAVNDGTLKLFDVVDARLAYTLHGHQGQVHCLEFSRDGNILCSGDSIGKILFWRTNFKQESQRLLSPTVILSQRDEWPENRHKRHNIQIQKKDLALSAEQKYRSSSRLRSSRSRSIEQSPVLVATPKRLPREHQPPRLHSRRSSPPKNSIIRTNHCQDSPKRSIGVDNQQSNQSIIKIEGAMQQMLEQMALLTETMTLMEKRLTRMEKKVYDSIG